MKKSMTKIVLAALFCGVAVAGAENMNTAEDAWYKLVGKKFSSRPEFKFVENNPDQPNVLIYGDSISIHYTQRVRKALEGKANVYRLFRNGGDSSTFVPKMTKMHDAICNDQLVDPLTFQWDVIQFNVGLHDLKYLLDGKHDKVNGQLVSSIEDYKKNLVGIVAYLKDLAPNAKLIFATTTPVATEEPGRVAGDSPKYNAAARQVLAAYPEIVINDLYAFTKPHQSEWQLASDNVHYNEAGFSAQGDEVARIIEKVLEGK